MKKPFSKNRTSRIRTKLFAAVIGVLVILLVLISVFSRPMLFRVFAFQTYRNLTNVSEAVNNLIPGSATYYFNLYSVAIKNNVDHSSNVDEQKEFYKINALYDLMTKFVG